LTSSSSQRARSWISSDTAASHPPDASTLGAPAVREPAPGENAPGEPDEALTLRPVADSSVQGQFMIVVAFRQIVR